MKIVKKKGLNVESVWNQRFVTLNQIMFCTRFKVDNYGRSHICIRGILFSQNACNTASFYGHMCNLLDLLYVN